MNTEAKTHSTDSTNSPQASSVQACQNCKKDFTIEPDDFGFYERIDVPPPTWCPECRMVRRMLSRNVRNLYKRKCDAPHHGEKIISIYQEDGEINVQDEKFWWSDESDGMKYGQDYDFSKPFFEQYASLLKEVPLPNLSNMNPVNSEFVSMTIDSKNCYLVFSSTRNEDCAYSEGINNCKGSMDLLSCHDAELLYSCVDCSKSFNLVFSHNVTGCSDSMFLYDCRNCSNCFGCWNLRNKSYCIWNEQYSKEEYFKKIKSFNLGSQRRLDEIKGVFKEKMKNAIFRFANMTNSKNSTGNNIENSRNSKFAFDVKRSDNSKYVWRFLEKGGSDNYDITVAVDPELAYEGNGVGSAYDVKFVIATGNQSHSYYTYTCISSCEYLFGCVGLKNKKYCILNKQYTKEEYEDLVPKIKQHMNDMPYIDKKGRVYKYGEFFPPEISLFGYNETMAQEYFPLTKEEALELGYNWKDKEERDYGIDLMSKEIPDSIEDIDESIIGKVIECAHQSDDNHLYSCGASCTEAFKVIREEFAFLKKAGLPLPRNCPNCRHFSRLKQKTPLRLWHKSCMCEDPSHEHPSSGGNGCSNEFETSYSPDRPEIIYCEKCYNLEVY